MPLEGLALQVKLLRPHAPVAAFLAAMMEPPPREVCTPPTVHQIHLTAAYTTVPTPKKKPMLLACTDAIRVDRD